MQLARMQDIGGCRAVVSSADNVYRLWDRYKQSRSNNEFHRASDYISSPKTSGYRSLHLVYKFQSKSPHRQVYNGLFIEIQLRSQVQHAWATAVETVDTMHDYDLKGGEGPRDWLDFFSATSSAFASMEGTAPVPGVPTGHNELREMVGDLEAKLEVQARLQAYGFAFRLTEEDDVATDGYYIIDLDRAQSRIRVWSFAKSEVSEVTDRYAELEREASDMPGRDVVLVSARSLSDLKRAYPNYFADTDRFLDELRRFLYRGA